MIDEKIDNRDLTAGLIYLAQQGFIKITRIEKNSIFKTVDYEMTIIKNLPTKDEGINGLISELFFTDSKLSGGVIKLSEIKKDKTIAKRISEFKKNISEEMVRNGWYDKNPNTIKVKYTSIGGFLMMLGFFISDLLLFILYLYF